MTNQISGDASFVRRKRRRRRGGDAASGPAQPSVALNNQSISDGASVGDLVGDLSVLNGIGSYTFALTSNPGGLFSISGSQLLVAAALSAGMEPIVVQADNGAGSTPSSPFSILVTYVGSFVPTFELWGF